MERTVSYRIKAIDDITGLFRRVNILNRETQSGFDKLGRKIDAVNPPARRLLGNIKQIGIEGQRAPGAAMAGFGKFKNFLTSTMLPAMAGVFAVDRVIQFGGSVVNTLAKFERFDAVLTNTLGSSTKAKKVMEDIVGLSSATPFNVDGLTDSWVRLANDGFRATMQEMTQMGDLASSRGKDVMMLTEAMIDASVGENERLKEFGIRAQKHGEKVVFTFRGVKTVVDRNSKAIKDYILGLGKLTGISGAMDAISKTTGGMISNLQDRWELFKLKLGTKLKPVIAVGIEVLSKLIDKMSGGLDKFLGDEAAIKKFADTASTKILAVIEGISMVVRELPKWWNSNKKGVLQFWDAISSLGKAIGPVLVIALRIGSVVVGITYGILNFGIKIVQFFINLGKSIFDFVKNFKQHFRDFFTWLETNFGFLADIIEIAFAPILAMIDVVKGAINFFSKKDGKTGNTFDGRQYSVKKVSAQPDPNANRGMMDFGGLSNFFAGPKKKETTPSDSDIYGSDGEGTGGTDGPGGKNKKISDRITEARGVQAGEIKHITINIDNLVRSLSIVTKKEDRPHRLKEEVSRILLDVVNNVNFSG